MTSDDARKKEDREAREARLAHQKIDGVAAAKEYRAKADRVVANTARLREERLAREAAAAQSPEPEPAKANEPAKAKRPPRTRATTPGTAK